VKRPDPLGYFGCLFALAVGLLVWLVIIWLVR
jgi:hypothetical protein